MTSSRFDGLLRWYPKRWRQRYGDELVALMEDTYGEVKVPLSKRRDVLRGAMTEHLRELGLTPGHAGPTERLRSGSLLVACGWTLFVIAGSAFAKMTEHWIGATPRADRTLTLTAYDVVQRGAAIGAGLVVVAALVALPAFIQFLRRGGWSVIRRPVTLALIVTALTGLLTVGMVAWVHFSDHANAFTHVVGSLWGTLIVATITTWALAALYTGRHLHLSTAKLRLEGVVALLLTSAMITVLSGVLIWSLGVADGAPRLLSSGLFGLPGASASIIIGLVMIAGMALGLGGASRVARSLNADVPSERAL